MDQPSRLVTVSIASSLIALAAGAMGCSPGGVTMGNRGGVERGTSPIAPDAGVPVSGRVSSGLEALYLFDEGVGTTIYDQSGALPALDLEIGNLGSVAWEAGGGLTIDAPVQISTSGPATRLTTSCQESNAVTVEVWAQSASLDQTGPARVVDFAVGPNDVNFAIAQQDNTSIASLRTTDVEDVTAPATTEANVDGFAAQDTHIVYTRSGLTDDADLWVNGVRQTEGTIAGSFDNWNPQAILTVGNEALGNRPWRGTVHLVAVYCRALSGDEIVHNFDEGY